MRSRYTAYVLRDERYLQLTWHGSTRPASRLLASSDSIKWLSLEIRASEETGSAATVEFVARYKEQGRAQRLHETSRFVREEGQWLYLDGSFTHSKK
jgi:SEC-C motif-containing protein